jgi:hypothetical protein
MQFRPGRKSVQNVNISIEFGTCNYRQVRMPTYISSRTISLLACPRVSHIISHNRLSQNPCSVSRYQIINWDVSVRAASVNISLASGLKGWELASNQGLINFVAFKSKNTLVIGVLRLSINHAIRWAISVVKAIILLWRLNRSEPIKGDHLADIPNFQ